jgi:hypothetical protein
MMKRAGIFFTEKELKELSYVRRHVICNTSGERIKRYSYGNRKIDGTVMFQNVGFAIAEHKYQPLHHNHLNTWELYTITYSDYPFQQEPYHKIDEVRPNGWNVDVNGEGCTPSEAITVEEMRSRVSFALDGKYVNINARWPMVVGMNQGVCKDTTCVDCARKHCPCKFSAEQMEYGCSEHLTSEEFEEIKKYYESR